MSRALLAPLGRIKMERFHLIARQSGPNDSRSILTSWTGWAPMPIRATIAAVVNAASPDGTQDFISQTIKRKSMKTVTVASAMLAGAALGVAAVNALHAQGKAPAAYAVVDISEITDANVFRQQLLPKVTPAALVPFGGQYIVRTENVTALDGTPPQRFVIIGFD